METENASQLVREFYNLQEDRIKVYKKLEEGHKAYLASSPDYDFLEYRQIVHDSTEDFKRISQRIIDIQAVLENEHKRTDIAACLKKIQDAEQDKLEKTAVLQLSKQRLQDEPDNEEHSREISDLKHKLAGIMEKITDLLEDLKYETEGLWEER